jgi:hypothetical protein
MPTVVVYSPSKGRSATNIGVFDEANTLGFLKGVLSGKIATAPLQEVGLLRGECSPEELSDSGDAGLTLEAENDDDLGDLLSEILGDEEQQRRQLEEELKAERKANKKDSSKKDKKKKKKKAKKKTAGNDRDEL